MTMSQLMMKVWVVQANVEIEGSPDIFASFHDAVTFIEDEYYPRYIHEDDAPPKMDHTKWTIDYDGKWNPEYHHEWSNMVVIECEVQGWTAAARKEHRRQMLLEVGTVGKQVDEMNICSDVCLS